MTLLDLLSRGARVEWHEAVALVREVVEQGRLEPRSVPELRQIELLPNGDVEVQGGVVVGRPVEQLGQMLETLISPATPPVEFSRLMAQPGESIEAFSESLAYFERPDRTAVLRDLYSRASGSSPVRDADELIASLRATAPAADKSEPKPGTVSQRHRLFYVAGVLALVGASVAVWALARRGSAASPMAASSGLTSEVSERLTGVADAIGRSVMSISERVGLSRGAAVPPPVKVENAKGQPATSLPPTPRSRSTKLEASTPPRVAAGSVALPSLRKDNVSQTETVAAPPPVVREERVIIASQPPDDTVYSASSPDVAAPVALRPQLPKALPAGLRPEAVARIELVIRADGTVASAKLLGQPRNVHDSMLLSAAKTWRFTPAMKDARAVPYRMAISVAR